MSNPGNGKSRCIAGTEFTREAIDEAVGSNTLLSIELEMTRLCNLRCRCV